MAWSLDSEEVEVDYRDELTVWIHVQNEVLELTLDDLVNLHLNMVQQAEEADPETEA